MIAAFDLFQQAVEANGSPATDEPEVKEPEPEVSSKDEEAMETDAKDLPEAVEKTEPVDEGEAKAEDQPKAPAAAPAAAPASGCSSGLPVAGYGHRTGAAVAAAEWSLPKPKVCTLHSVRDNC